MAHRPPPVAPGDRVAILATSGAHASLFPHVFELGLERLEERFDLEPVVYPSVDWSPATLREEPTARAEELERAFADPDIAGVMATIGGDDQLRVLPHLDAGSMANNPTRYFGYSDNTAFATYLWNRDVVSYQGPMVMTELAMQGSLFEYTVEYARRALFGDDLGEIRPPDVTTDDDLDWDDPATLADHRETEAHPGFTWRGGESVATGSIVGGNLETLASLWLAGRAVPERAALEGSILALETSELLPPEWYVEQVLQSFGERGCLDAVDGVMVGRAKARSLRTPRPPAERAAYRTRQREAIADTVGRYNPDAPIVFEVPFGHTSPTVPLPIGAEATLDPIEGTIVVT